MTQSDRFWLKVNKNIVLILLGTLPMALLWPGLALGFIGWALFFSCRSFLVFGSRASGHDALRFIMTLPFSRRDILMTYVKGILGLGGGYVLLVALLRGILLWTGVHYTGGWGAIGTGMDLVGYGIVLFIFSVIMAVFQISLLKYYTQSKFGGWIALSLLVVYPGMYVLYYLKTVIQFVSAMMVALSYDILGVDRSSEYSGSIEKFLNLGLADEMAQSIAFIIYGIVLIGVVALFINEVARGYKIFCWRKRNVEKNC
jgi:hypothetical protein